MNGPGPGAFAYQEVYHYVSALIDASAACPSATDGRGERLPALRVLAARLGTSISTVQAAYALLEAQGRIYAVPKSGYFVCYHGHDCPVEPDAELLPRMIGHAHQPQMRVLSQYQGTPPLALEPALHRGEHRVLRQQPRLVGLPVHPCGDRDLRRALAARYSHSVGHCWSAEHVYVGTDACAVLRLLGVALQLKGEPMLVVVPCCWRILRTLRSLGIKVVEYPLSSRGRIDPAQLRRLLNKHSIRWVLLDSTLSSPHGTLMPPALRCAIAQLLDERGAWVIENDLMGDLCFTDTPRLRALLNPDRLLVIGSLEHAVGHEGGYGFLLSRHFAAALRSAFHERSARLATLRQKAIAGLLENGEVDRHVRQLNTCLQARHVQMHKQLVEHLGNHLDFHQPCGGTAVWARCRHPVDMRQVFERLLTQRIVIAPGELFSLGGLFRQHLLLALPAGDAVEAQRLWQALAEALQGQEAEE